VRPPRFARAIDFHAPEATDPPGELARATGQRVGVGASDGQLVSAKSACKASYDSVASPRILPEFPVAEPNAPFLHQ
jgi:hypothetical protein